MVVVHRLHGVADTAAAVRSVLAGHGGGDIARAACPGCGGPHGKPYLPDSDLRFNVSHTADVLVVAVARGLEVGVDVETVRRRSVDRLARRVLTAAEQAALGRAGDPVAAFAACWTRKEAVAKAAGLGLLARFADLEVGVPPAPAPVVPLGGRDWRLYDGDAGPGLPVAVAVEGATGAEPEWR